MPENEITQDQMLRMAIARADEHLALLAAVPIKDTSAARQAMVETRLTVLERFHTDVKAIFAPTESPAV